MARLEAAAWRREKRLDGLGRKKRQAGFARTEFARCTFHMSISGPGFVFLTFSAKAPEMTPGGPRGNGMGNVAKRSKRCRGNLGDAACIACADEHARVRVLREWSSLPAW